MKKFEELKDKKLKEFKDVKQRDKGENVIGDTIYVIDKALGKNYKNLLKYNKNEQM